MNKTKVVIAHLGARKHYQEPILFHQWGILETFYTDFYARNNLINQILRSPTIFSILPKSAKKMLDRYSPELSGAKIIDFPFFGIEYATSKKKASFENVHPIFLSAGKIFNQKIITKGLGKANIVYGFNSASLELFQLAKSQGIKCILDQTIAVSSLEYQLMSEEEEKWKNWSMSPFQVTQFMKQKAERARKEQELADHIVCGSDFVKSSLIDEGIPQDKITVVSLGSIKQKPQIFNQNSTNQHNTKKSTKGLSILFAGNVGLRKGIPYLLEALKILKNQIPFICKIAGNITIKQEKVEEYQDLCQFLGRVPRSEMIELYQWADVFVLPSICEGSAMVTYEALMFGLPIITTYNSGSIVRNGVDGFIVPIRNSEAIADSLIKIFDDPTKFSNLEERLNYLQCVNISAQEKLKNLVTSL